MNKKYLLLDLFSGAGGLSAGFEHTGKFKVAGAIEINRAAQQTYVMNHGGQEDLIIKSPETGRSDITKINFKDLGLVSDETVIIGGPPCQGFSNANRQKNYLISGNNKLVKEFARAIKEVRPAAFLMENVKSINSAVHKFFVTLPGEDENKDFSSRRHLDDISNKGEPIYQEDFIELMSSDNELLRSIINKYESLDSVPFPIISDQALLTRLRSLERKIKKSKTLDVSKDSERREIGSIIAKINSINNPILNDLMEQTEQAFNLLMLFGSLETRSIKESLEAFFELNRFLTRCNELKEEKIECSPFTFINEEKYKVCVKVYSYSVIQYLETLFSFYGYSIDKGVLDASDFGVPQKRKRFMMMGIRGSRVKAKLPKSNQASMVFSVHDAISDLEEIEPQQEIENYNPNVYKTASESHRLTKYFRKDIDAQKIYDHINTKSSPLIQERYQHILELGGKNFHSLPDELKDSYADASRTQNTVYLRLDYDKPSPTVINVRKSMWQHPNKARSLSIREAARLQSFPDSFRFCGNKDERYQQIGNAVPPKLAEAVAMNILNQINKI